jgi:hypothetical protein
MLDGCNFDPVPDAYPLGIWASPFVTLLGYAQIRVLPFLIDVNGDDCTGRRDRKRVSGNVGLQRGSRGHEVLHNGIRRRDAWANAHVGSVFNGAKPMYCPAGKLALYPENFIDILNREINERSDRGDKDQNMLLGLLLLSGLQRTFPCDQWKISAGTWPNSRLAFAVIRASWAGESFPARSSLVANSSALIWWVRSSMGYLRCFGMPNTELGSRLRVAAFSFAIS